MNHKNIKPHMSNKKRKATEAKEKVGIDEGVEPVEWIAKLDDDFNGHFTV